MTARTRRSLIPALLTLSLGLHAVTLMSGSGREAFAAAAAWLDDLGPATSLTLVGDGSEDAEDVVIKNREGRVAFGDDAAATAWALGTVNDRAIIQKLMASPRVEEQRTALREELQAQQMEFQTRIQAIITEAQTLDPNDERNAAALQDIEARYRQATEEFQQWQEGAAQKSERLDGDALQQAYRDFVAAVDVVAEARGIDLVFRAMPADAEFDSPGMSAVSSSIRMRTAVIVPDGIDLTEDVIDELGL